jgi:hypothetical protein
VGANVRGPRSVPPPELIVSSTSGEGLAPSGRAPSKLNSSSAMVRPEIARQSEPPPVSMGMHSVEEEQP